MALWGNARANAYHTSLYGRTDESRYWGANIPRTISPDMSKKARSQLIHEKYVLKSWVSTEPGWEMEMQKGFPLNMDELAVLEYLNEKPGEIHRPLSIRSPTPAKRPTSRLPEERVPEKRPISRDSRWSDEVICDGRSVRLAVIEDDQFPRLHRSEKIINDGRQRQRTSHRTKHKVDTFVPEDDVPKSTLSTKEETVREAWENVGHNSPKYNDPVPNSRNIICDLGQRSTEERLVSKALSETPVNQTRRRWRTAKNPGEVGKSGIAVRQIRSRARCRRTELDEEKGLKIDRLFESNVLQGHLNLVLQRKKNRMRVRTQRPRQWILIDYSNRLELLKLLCFSHCFRRHRLWFRRPKLKSVRIVRRISSPLSAQGICSMIA